MGLLKIDPRLDPRRNPYFWDDAGPPPPGLNPTGQICHPHTGEPITDPLVVAALLQGLCDWRNPYGPRVLLNTFLSINRKHRQKVLFCNLSERQLITMQKLSDPDYGVMADLTWFCKVYGCSRYRAATRIADWGIPVYQLETGMYFFVGDLAKALEARRMDLKAYGRAELRALAKRDFYRARKGLRRAGAAPPAVARDDDEEADQGVGSAAR